MFKIIGIMFAGIFIGYLLRKRKGIRHISSTTMATIVILLFVMGSEIGSNKGIVENILSLGGEALLISLAATAGSVLAAAGLYMAMFRKKGSAE